MESLGLGGGEAAGAAEAGGIAAEVGELAPLAALAL